jgi:hypothetical protein
VQSRILAMAASCISVSLSIAGAVSAAGVRENAVGVARQTGRIAIAGPSASLSLVAGFAGLSLAAFRGVAKSGRNAGIAARAADLESSVGVEDGETDFAESSPPPPAAPQAAAQGTKLYVGNLPWSVHSKQLAEYFQDVGNVELVEVILLLPQLLIALI